MALHWPFGHLSPKLWAKEGPGVKLAIWLPTIKSRESTSSRPPNWEYDMAFERSWQGLQLWFKPRRELWTFKVPGLQSKKFRDNFGTPTWESREKEPFGCSLDRITQKILYGGRWWLPPSPGRGESCGPKCPWLVPTPKGVPKCETNPVWLVFGCRFKLDLLVPLPSLIPRLLACPSTLYSARSREHPSESQFRNSTKVNPQVGSPWDLGVRQKSCTWLLCLNNAWDSCVNDTNPWKILHGFGMNPWSL